MNEVKQGNPAMNLLYLSATKLTANRQNAK